MNDPFTVLLRAFFALTGVFLSINSVSGQSYIIHGKITDGNDKQPVPGAYIYLDENSDSTKRRSTFSAVDGGFFFTGLKKTNYRIIIENINYQRYTENLVLSEENTSLDTLKLIPASKLLDEVIVTGQGTAIQKGDTTVMTADAFKVNSNANAEDLIKKMPGISVENGVVKARGEEVKKVLVDGKPFFGDDPSVALRNLPADVIDKVQVYNKLSDQAELTGFDDGESNGTINIVTRKNSKYSTFGKLVAGTDFSEKYLAGGNINAFSGARRITLTGMSNNINQQNFAMQDLIGISGRGRGWGGRSFGSQAGISKNHSLGMNYQDNWGRKVSVSGSYFYNASSNTNYTRSKTEYLSDSPEGKYAADTSNTFTENDNHRLNLRLEYKPDTLNSFILVPRLSMQNNSSDREVESLISGGNILKYSSNSIDNNSTGFNAGNDFTWRHKFRMKGRTFSFRSSLSYDNRQSDKTQMALVNDVQDNQLADNNSYNLMVINSVNYTEPLGKFNLVQLNVNSRIRKADNNKELFELPNDSQKGNRLDSLSNIYNNTWITNKGALSLLRKRGDLRISVGIGFENAMLKGNQSFPEKITIHKTFANWMPEFSLNYRYSEISHIRFSYRTSSEAPEISDLQNVIDNTDRLRLSTGNSNLKQSYNHIINSNYSYANPTSGFNLFAMMRASWSKDILSNKTVRALGDTLYKPDGFDITLYPGQQITFPVNMNHSWNANTMVNVGYFVKPLKCNFSVVTGIGFSVLPEYIQSDKNTQRTTNLSNSLIVASNISQDVDFTLSYTSNYSKAKNSLPDFEDEEYWYQSVSGKLNLTFLKNFVFNTDVISQFNSYPRNGTSKMKERYVVWNASAGTKFLKNRSAEIKLGVYDILNQNKSYYHTVTASSVKDSWTNAYKRYFMVLLTWNFKTRPVQQ